MMTRYGVWMDEIPLHEIDPAVYVIDIEESVPAVNVMTSGRGMGDGTHVLSRRRQSLSVTVRVMVHEYDIAKRKEIFGKIAEWATNGKYLMISDRPGQRLRVSCDIPPTAGSSLRWTNIVSVTFTAYEKPYWEDTEKTTISKTGESGSMTMNVPGNAGKTTVDVKVENTGGAAITDFTVAVGDTQFAFPGINIAPGATASYEYDDEGILHIPAQNRTPESSDDLLAVCGANNAVSFTASGSCTVTVSARGRWL